MRTNDHVHVQSLLPFTDARARLCVPFKTQLLKWVGNKQRFAHEIVSYFPRSFGTYYEPFVGSGAVLATLAPQRAVASDAFSPLMEIWRELKRDPDELASWYAERWNRTKREPNDAVYQRVKSSFNQRPNGADLLYLCRACYGGIVRFRKADGYMSTPCGVHQPIDPASFKKRTVEWHKRCRKAAVTFEKRCNVPRPEISFIAIRRTSILRPSFTALSPSASRRCLKKSLAVNLEVSMLQCRSTERNDRGVRHATSQYPMSFSSLTRP